MILLQIEIKVNALIDTGSPISFVKENLFPNVLLNKRMI